MGCIKLDILDNEYRKSELKISSPKKELTFNFSDRNVCNHSISTMMVTDLTANVTQAVLYAPFGQIISEYRQDWMLDTLPRYLFNAKEYDEESGLYYFVNRYQDPKWGTFISRDLLFEKFFWCSGYSYCLNNPIKLVDPDGNAPRDNDRPFGQPTSRTVPTPKTTTTTAPSRPTTSQLFNLSFNLVMNRNPAVKVTTEAVRGTANTLLFLGGIGQALIGGSKIALFNDGDKMAYPKWCTPRQFDKNWNFERKTGWLGMGEMGDIDKKEIPSLFSNTLSSILLFVPFSKAATTGEKLIENTVVGSSITTPINMAIDAVQDATSTPTTNTNSTNTTTNPTQDKQKTTVPQ